MSLTTEPTTGPAQADRLPAGALLIISLLVGSAFVMILNETIMSVALPVLIVDLQISASTAQWLTSGFLLTMAVVIPITGYLLQRFPPRSVYLGSMSVFSAGTLLSALAPAFPVLLAGRIVNALDYVGVMGVELFVTREGLLVNEIARLLSQVLTEFHGLPKRLQGLPQQAAADQARGQLAAHRLDLGQLGHGDARYAHPLPNRRLHG